VCPPKHICILREKSEQTYNFTYLRLASRKNMHRMHPIDDVPHTTPYTTTATTPHVVVVPLVASTTRTVITVYYLTTPKRQITKNIRNRTENVCLPSKHNERRSAPQQLQHTTTKPPPSTFKQVLLLRRERRKETYNVCSTFVRLSPRQQQTQIVLRQRADGVSSTAGVGACTRARAQLRPKACLPACLPARLVQ
jgi:hypothetical protein